MAYVKIINGTPTIYSLRDLRRDNPQVSFPAEPSDERLAEWDIYPLAEGAKPAPERWQRVVKGPVEQVAGVWTQTYVTEDRLATAEGVKAEAYRRIVAVIPEWKQRNLTAQATQLLHKGTANWTPEDQAAWDAGNAIWGQVAAIRAASDQIEAMDPIPTDFMDDSYWP